MIYEDFHKFHIGTYFDCRFS